MPVKALLPHPEPATHKHIVDAIARLEDMRPGTERRLQGWIDVRIGELQKRLEGLK
jgi:hypothetical protein